MMTASNYKNDSELQELFRFVWLDDQVNKSAENLELQKKLSTSVPNCSSLIVFDNASECEQYLLQYNDDQNIIMIVSGSLGQTCLPNIHYLAAISIIYVYCFDKKVHDLLAQQYKKIKAVTCDMNELFPKLLFHGRMNDKLLFSLSDEQSTTILNAEFMYSKLIVDMLMQIDPLQSDWTEFEVRCKKEYDGNETESKKIKNFMLEYEPTNALRWYTRDSFVYRLLNKAFRLKDIDFLFLFRFFIRDLYDQLQGLPSPYEKGDTLRVYRGQSLKPDEFERLKSYVGGFISLNSFTSTSRERLVAEWFIEQDGVLFEIECHLTSAETTKKSYGDISSTSFSPDEAEVLFMPGSIFRIDQIENNDDSIPIIKLILIADDAVKYPLQQLHQHIQDDLLHEKNNGAKLIGLGVLLHEMGMRDKAGQYYQKLLKLYGKEEGVSDFVRYAMEMYDDKKPNDEKLNCFLNELDNLRQTSPGNYEGIIQCHHLISITYLRRDNIPLALEHRQTALHLARDNCRDANTLEAIQYQALAIIYEKQGNSDQLALENHQKSLAIREKYLPQYHAQLVDSNRSIALIYHKMKNYEESLNYFMKTLEIQKHSLTPTHNDLGFTYWQIGVNYQLLKQYNQAKQYYQQGFDIFQKNHANDDEMLKNMKQIIENNEKLLLADQTIVSI